MANETALLAAQRVAIQDLRMRFERGELPIETFRETLDALGESVSGVAAWGHEEHEPELEAEASPARAEVEIEAFTLMGNIHVKLIQPQIPTIGSLVRDVLQAAAMGVRRGLLTPQQ